MSMKISLKGSTIEQLLGWSDAPEGECGAGKGKTQPDFQHEPTGFTERKLPSGYKQPQPKCRPAPGRCRPVIVSMLWEVWGTANTCQERSWPGPEAGAFRNCLFLRTGTTTLVNKMKWLILYDVRMKFTKSSHILS